MKTDHIGERISFTEHGNNVYDQNILIADLNALNAALAGAAVEEAPQRL